MVVCFCFDYCMINYPKLSGLKRLVLHSQILWVQSPTGMACVCSEMSRDSAGKTQLLKAGTIWNCLHLQVCSWHCLHTKISAGRPPLDYLGGSFIHSMDLLTIWPPRDNQTSCVGLVVSSTDVPANNVVVLILITQLWRAQNTSPAVLLWPELSCTCQNSRGGGVEPHFLLQEMPKNLGHVF